MKTTNTAARLKEIMSERNLRQVDILNAAKPYCTKFGIKLEKNDLSQYVNGKVEPGQEKLTILGLALNVSETWLMGYDVSPSRDVIAFPSLDAFPSSQTSALTEAQQPMLDRNLIRIAGRDGSYKERYLTDEQLAALTVLIDQLPDVPDDL